MRAALPRVALIFTIQLACNAGAIVDPHGSPGARMPPAQQAIPEAYPDDLVLPGPHEATGFYPFTAVPQRLYLAFDGARIRSGTCSDATAACSFVAKCDADIPAFTGGPAIRRTITEAVRRYFQPYALEVTTDRPETGPYTMCVIGGSSVDLCRGAGSAGLAPLDCGNENPADVVFAFEDDRTQDTDAIAVTVAQEVAHAFGLGHTDDERDVLYPFLTGTAEGFLDRDMGSPDRSLCPGRHQQNSHRMLRALLGPGAGNPNALPAAGTVLGGAESLRILSPEPGAVLGAASIVEASVDDPRIVHAVELRLDPGTKREHAMRISVPPYAARLVVREPGKHVLEATAIDADQRVGRVRLEVEIAARPSP